MRSVMMVAVVILFATGVGAQRDVDRPPPPGLLSYTVADNSGVVHRLQLELAGLRLEAPAADMDGGLFAFEQGVVTITPSLAGRVSLDAAGRSPDGRILRDLWLSVDGVVLMADEAVGGVGTLTLQRATLRITPGARIQLGRRITIPGALVEDLPPARP